MNMMTNQFYSFNGEISSEPFNFSTQNRAFNYGDGLFETIKIVQGAPLFHLSHYSRLVRGLIELKIDVPEEFSVQYFLNSLIRLIEANKCFTGIIRVQAFRNSGGKYTPTNHEFSWLAETFPTDKTTDFYQETPEKYVLGVFKDVRKDFSTISFAKTCNALPYILAGNYAREHQLDNVVLFNSKDEVVETVAENLFIYKNGVVSTPSIESGAILGICRSTIKKLLLWNKIECNEKTLYIEDLENAEEIFLTNSVRGIIRVSEFQGKQYGNKFSQGILNKLNERISIMLTKR